MDDLELARTVARRIATESELATTLVREPRATIVPETAISPSGAAALSALRALGGSMAGRIAVQRTLGEGGMGIVHLATQATVGREVAVKTLRGGAGDMDATLRILREAWVTGALEHPNVVPIYDVGVDEAGAPVIVMKRIEGRDWTALMHAPDEIARLFGEDDPLEWNLRIFESVCNAVHFAHSRGILHRDLKPDNVMIGAFGEVYLLDWGIAVSLRDDPSGRLPQAAHATGIAGTPYYFAPEMLLGDPRALSPRTDVYLLGAILFEIFAGAPPHRGDTLEALIASALISTPTFPEGFPSEAAAICRRALSRDPEGRHESADALRVAALDYAQHRGSRKLAFQAKQSFSRLLSVLELEPPGEDKTLAVFNLLGECRFGYRAALSAWSENEVAKNGLDRAVLAVVEHELAGGDAHAAAALLREVASPPAEVAARVEAAVRARIEQDDRLRRLETDLDPQVGTRTRSFILTIFGFFWVTIPLAAWIFQATGGVPTYSGLIGFSVLLLGIAVLLFVWARESLTKTLLNRRLSSTLGLHLGAQILLAIGASFAGIPVAQGESLNVFTWTLTQTLLAVWVEPWFGVPATVNAVAFLIQARFPSLRYPLMALSNLIFTVVMVRVWVPRSTIEKIREGRLELRRKALQWLREVPTASGRFDDRGT